MATHVRLAFVRALVSCDDNTLACLLLERPLLMKPITENERRHISSALRSDQDMHEAGWSNAPFGAPHQFWLLRRRYGTRWWREGEMYLLRCNDNVLECLQLLARAGMDPRERMPEIAHHGRARADVLRADSNLLHYFGRTNTVYRQAYEIVQWLVEQGVEINERNKHGMTPLAYAMRSNNAPHVRALIANGADMHLKLKLKREEASILEHSNQGGCLDAHSVLMSFSGWSPSTHRTLSEEKKEQVQMMMNIYSWGGYDESAPLTRIHDLPRELMFEIIGMSLFGVAPSKVGDGMTLAESGEAHPFDWLEAAEQE
eukprot:TRINITY_DN2815_c1_g2_i1.p1 TRINITY_DN2815_c1_g2~~TRINITY_DN2815_c1_g2_i1.p1  ORF type:complete len:315 (-),score=49.50 TRINITY_DN2815_c1_g2_i1:434-1378(-)